jgi:hypothetical protein
VLPLPRKKYHQHNNFEKTLLRDEIFPKFEEQGKTNRFLTKIKPGRDAKNQFLFPILLLYFSGESIKIEKQDH